MVVPALSGPYDLGAVTVRVAISVDPVTAQVTAVSDPIPQILEGVPLRLRKIQVNLDRPGFTINPTNCDAYSVDAAISGDEGGLSNQSAHFQVGNCSELPFGPKLGLKLRGSTKHTGHPALQAVLRTGEGESNLQRAVVTMPRVELLDNAHIDTVCTRVQFAEGACPAGSLLGNATAFTPLLAEPLSGAVYLRSSNHQLPDLVADLRGQFRVELSGRIDAVQGGRLRSTFASIPDIAVDKFVLNLQGGKKGLLANSEDLCRSQRTATVKLIGQNGVRTTRNTDLQTGCGSGKSSSKRNDDRQLGDRVGTVR